MAGKDYGPKGCCQGAGVGIVVLSWAAVAEAVIKVSIVAGWLF